MWTATDSFNAFEVLLWSGIGAELARRGLRSPKGERSRMVFASVAFFAFAASDAVEIITGAWWRPWWLLVWKAACVIVLVTLYVQYRLSRPGTRRPS